MVRDTIPHRLLERAREQGDRPALWHQHDGVWRAIGWREYADRCRAFAGALLAEGNVPGDAVAIMGNNCPEWLIADLGAMFARGVAAGIYQTSTPEQAAYVAGHCEAKVVVVEDAEQYRKIAAMRDRLPALRRIVMVRDAESVDDPQAVSFASFLARGDKHRGEVDRRLDEINDVDLATLIYTSGTTGPPKGVMLSHGNLAFTSHLAVEIFGQATQDDCIVSYLPLSHIAEQMLSLHVPISAGFPVWIADRFDRVKETLIAARPTIFLGVPRVWEKFKAAMEAKLAEATGVKKAIVQWARKVGAEAGPQIVAKGAANGLLGLQHQVADRLFYGKVKQALGLDRLRCAVSGAAPIGRDVLDFFLSINVVIHEVYGQSEDCGPTTFNQPFPGKRKIGTVGQPVPGVQVRIAEDGEILVRGQNVFVGYYKEPAATAEALADGWLHSGDIGEFDGQGFLRITDRKKDLIITAGGKNVAPQNIEKQLRGIEGVGNAVVIGDRRKYLVALLTLDPEAAPALAARNGWPASLDELARAPGFRAHVQAGIDAANKQLAQYESIKRFALLPNDFSVESGELTPTQKVKRKVVYEKHATVIEGLYAEAN